MNKKQSIEDVFSEIRASLDTPEDQSILKRIDFERLLKMSLEEIVDRFDTHQVRVLSDLHIAGKTGADLLVQIDDYEVRIEILEQLSKDEKISGNQLEVYKRVFEENPSTQFLILTWVSDDITSIVFSLQDILTLEEEPDEFDKLLSNSKPLSENLENIIVSQLKNWDTEISFMGDKKKQSVDLKKKEFQDNLPNSINHQINKQYRNPEKIEAVSTYSVREESNLIKDALNIALSGESAESISKIFSRIKKGGKK